MAIAVAIESGLELHGTDCPADICSKCGELVEHCTNYCSNCGARFIYRYIPEYSIWDAYYNNSPYSVPHRELGVKGWLEYRG